MEIVVCGALGAGSLSLLGSSFLLGGSLVALQRGSGLPALDLKCQPQQHLLSCVVCVSVGDRARCPVSDAAGRAWSGNQPSVPVARVQAAVGTGPCAGGVVRGLKGIGVLY